VSKKNPPIWFAEPTVTVNPCTKGSECVAEAVDFPAKNEFWNADTLVLRLAGAANEVLAVQLYVEKCAGQVDSIRIKGIEDLELSVFLHVSVPHKDRFYDDALVPLPNQGMAAAARVIATQAPQVADRQRQGFFLEIYVPRGTPAGERQASLLLNVAGKDICISVALTIYDFELPDRTDCVADINNYGSAPATGFDGLSSGDDFPRFLNIERAYFRMAREHRALFHLLPFSQSGRVEENYAPRLAGAGRNRRIVDWQPFDKHWGPYLDGSAFKGVRGGEQPVENLYLPINLNWPAFFEKFGTPGYEMELKLVLTEMAQHFRERGWTETNFEVYFNHKVSWKYFAWDIDETFYQRDRYIILLLARMVNQVAKDFPEIKIINRIDSSDLYSDCAREDEGREIQSWVVHRNLHSLDPEASKLLRDNGQAVWFYGGSSQLTAPNRLDSLRWPWMAWGRETDGFCWWCGTIWGTWEDVAAGDSHCFYPGEPFGIEGPLASLRLKVLHRAMQDCAYLQLLTDMTGSRTAAHQCIAGTIGCRDREDWFQRQEKMEVAQDEIQSSTSSSQPWNTAPRAAWIQAREALAQAIEAKGSQS
jgi:hypothetical protein